MQMSEAQQALLKHWSGFHLRKGVLPSRNDFKLKDLGKYVTNIVIVDVTIEPLDFEYRLVGTGVSEFMHQDYTGTRISAIPGKGPESTVWYNMKRTYEEGAPHYLEAPYIGPRQGQVVVNTLYLPLASDNRTVDKLLIVPHFDSRTAIIHVGLQTLH